MKLWLVRSNRFGRPAIVSDQPEPDAYIAGPFASTDDAFDALQWHERAVQRRATVVEAAMFVGILSAAYGLLWVVLA